RLGPRSCSGRRLSAMLRGSGFGLSATAAIVGSRNGITRVDRQCRGHYWNADFFWHCLSDFEGVPNWGVAEFAISDERFGARFGHGRLYLTRAPVDFDDLLACCDLARQKAVLADARMGMVSAASMGSCRGAGVFDVRLSDCFSEAAAAS